MIETDLNHQPIVIDDLDADWLLAMCEDAEIMSREAERRRLRLALQWALRHPADPEDVAKGHVETVGGPGTPDVEELTTEPLAAADLGPRRGAAGAGLARPPHRLGDHRAASSSSTTPWPAPATGPAPRCCRSSATPST